MISFCSYLNFELIDLHGDQFVHVCATELTVKLLDKLLFIGDHLAKVVSVGGEDLLELALVLQMKI